MEDNKPWYENIPDQGVLCWVSDDNDNDKKRIRLINQYRHSNDYKFVGECDWTYATPITNDEIKSFLRDETPEASTELRHHFAGLAMQSYLASSKQFGSKYELALHAYQMADAMIQAVENM